LLVDKPTVVALRPLKVFFFVSVVITRGLILVHPLWGKDHEVAQYQRCA